MTVTPQPVYTGLFEGKGRAGGTCLPPLVTATHAHQILHSSDAYCYLSVYLTILLLSWLHYTHIMNTQSQSQSNNYHKQKLLWNFDRFEIWKFLGCKFCRLGSVCDLEKSKQVEYQCVWCLQEKRNPLEFILIFRTLRHISKINPEITTLMFSSLLSSRS